MLVYKIRWPDFDLQRGEEHHTKEQKEDGSSLCRHSHAKEILANWVVFSTEQQLNH